MQKYLTLSDRASGPQSTGVRDANILIWPESAFPFFLTREADAMAQIADLLPKGTVLITGSVRAPELPPGRAGHTRLQFDLRDRSRRQRAIDLRQAASGPVRRISSLPGLDGKNRPGATDQGSRRNLFRAPGGAAWTSPMHRARVPLICYEAIFPGDVAESDDRPAGSSISPMTAVRHFDRPVSASAKARLRAIEQGLPVVRAANTGISAVVDPLGRIVAKLDLGIEGVLDSPLPSAIAATIYTRVGDIPAASIVAARLYFCRQAPRREANVLTSAYENPPVDRSTAPFAFCAPRLPKNRPVRILLEFPALIIHRSSEQDLTVSAPEATQL